MSAPAQTGSCLLQKCQLGSLPAEAESLHAQNPMPAGQSLTPSEHAGQGECREASPMESQSSCA